MLKLNHAHLCDFQETDGSYRMDYLQNGVINEKSSYYECDGDSITKDQTYMYSSGDCTKDYLHLNSVKAFLHIEGKCHSVCWGNVTLK